MESPGLSGSLVHMENWVWGAAVFEGYLWSIFWMAYSIFPISTRCVSSHYMLGAWLYPMSHCKLLQLPHLSALPELRVGASLWVRSQPQATPLLIWASLWTTQKASLAVRGLLASLASVCLLDQHLLFYEKIYFYYFKLSVWVWVCAHQCRYLRGQRHRIPWSSTSYR